MMTEIEEIDIPGILNFKEKEGDALVLLGCGGSLEDWVKGIHEYFIEQRVIDESYEWPIWYKIIQEDLVCLVVPLNEEVNSKRLAIVRLQMVDAKWLADLYDQGFSFNQEID
jgi:hypothetical protein